MVDIHCHLLPNIDDGPATWEETYELASDLKEAGFEKIIATPHCWGPKFDSESVKSTIAKTQKTLNQRGIEIEIFSGAEIYFESGAVFDAGFHSGLCLGGSKFLLIEFGFLSMPRGYEEFRFSAETKGYNLIIAHPCRYPALNLDRIENFVSHGSFIQVNIGSLSGKYGPDAQKKSKSILEAGICHFLATDSHSPCGADREKITREIGHAKKMLGEEVFFDLAKTNPSKILSGDKPSSIKPVHVQLKSKRPF